MALVFAIGDGHDRVGLTHLDAGRAVWARAEAAWRWLYGDRLGDPLAERLRAAIDDAGPAGITRTAIRDVVGSRNTPASRIETALSTLERAGLATPSKVSSSRSGGRPAEVWTAGPSGATGDGNDGRNGNEPLDVHGPAVPSHRSHPSHDHRGRGGAAGTGDSPPTPRLGDGSNGNEPLDVHGPAVPSHRSHPSHDDADPAAATIEDAGAFSGDIDDLDRYARDLTETGWIA